MNTEPPRFTEVTQSVPHYRRQIAVRDPSLFKPNDVLFVTRTGETMWVDQAGDHLHVTRGVGTQPAPLLRGDEILQVGHAAR